EGVGLPHGGHVGAGLSESVAEIVRPDGVGAREVTHTRPLAGSSATAHGAEGTGNIWWRRTGEVEYTSSVSPTVSLATTDPLENVLSMPAPFPARRSGPACSSSRSMLAS